MKAKTIATLDRIVAKANDPNYLKEAGQYVQTAAKLMAPADSGYLRNSIFLEVEPYNEGMEATVYTNLQYAPYVEFGTGPKGAANHAGISPEVTVAYTMEPWWIHESQVDSAVADRYHWLYIDTEQGRFYRCDGQPAQPFMYPALHDNIQTVMDILRRGMKEAMK